MNGGVFRGRNIHERVKAHRGLLAQIEDEPSPRLRPAMVVSWRGRAA
jgi:hypothetical protein